MPVQSGMVRGMSYDAGGVIVGVGLACFLSAVLLAKRRHRWAAGPALLAAALFAEKVNYWTFEYAYRPQRAAVMSWGDQATFADAVLSRATVAAAYLPWSATPLCVGILAAVIAWRATPRVRWPAFASLVAGCPSAILFWWAFVSPTDIIPRDDPRWQWGYYVEWLEAGADVGKGGGPCWSALNVATDDTKREQLLNHLQNRSSKQRSVSATMSALLNTAGGTQAFWKTSVRGCL